MMALFIYHPQQFNRVMPKEMIQCLSRPSWIVVIPLIYLQIMEKKLGNLTTPTVPLI